MNESRPESGPPRAAFTVDRIRDVLARIVAAREELIYQPDEAAAILADLEVELAAFAEGAS